MAPATAAFRQESPLSRSSIHSLCSVPHDMNPALYSRKRQLCTEVDSEVTFTLQPPPKRRKQEETPKHKTPHLFWENLPRLWLTPRSLREFDQRTAALSSSPTPSISNICELAEDHTEQLKLFAQNGGPDLSDLRSYPEVLSSHYSSKSVSEDQVKSDKLSDMSPSTSAYDKHFESHLAQNGIYIHNHIPKPKNWAVINQRMLRPRASLTLERFSDDDFEAFVLSNEMALKENKVIEKSYKTIAGNVRTFSMQDRQVGNLAILTDGSIVNPRPDVYDGASPTTVDQRIRDALNNYIIPSTTPTRPCVPNFFVEVKGPAGDVVVAKRQAGHYGALGARGVHELRRYIDPATASDGNAYTITSTYDSGSGTLSIHAVHTTLTNDSNIPLEYRMTTLDSFCMIGNPKTFREGACAFRNARDWAQETRDELITQANQKASA